MAPRFLTILTGRNVPKVGQPREPEPSTINEKTIADFTRVVEQTQREPPADKARPPELMPSSYGQPSRAPRGRAQRRNGGWRGRASAVALSKPVMKYLSNGATNPIHARYYCGGNNLPKVRIRAHPPPAAPPFAASKPGSFGAGSTLQTHNAA